MSSVNSRNRITANYLILVSLAVAISTIQLAQAQILTTLYSFGAIPYDGDFPETTLAMDSQGNLYGTTAGGGKGQAPRVRLRNRV